MDKNAKNAVQNKPFHIAKQFVKNLSTLSTAYYKHHRILLFKYYFKNKKKEEYIVNMGKAVDEENSKREEVAKFRERIM